MSEPGQRSQIGALELGEDDRLLVTADLATAAEIDSRPRLTPAHHLGDPLVLPPKLRPRASMLVSVLLSPRRWGTCRSRRHEHPQRPEMLTAMHLAMGSVAE